MDFLSGEKASQRRRTASGTRRVVTVAFLGATLALPAMGVTSPAQSAQSPAKLTVHASPQFPDVAEMTPRMPSAQELAGDSVRQFVADHATVHYFNTGVRGNLAHWRGGKQSICPAATGLSRSYNTFVTMRIRALAANVDAPVDDNSNCTPNVRVYFTTDPQQMMSHVTRWASVYLRKNGQYARNRRLLEFTDDHPIQGWYVTTPAGARVLNSDLGLLPVNLEPVWPRIAQNTGTDTGDMSGIGSVVMVIDTTKVAGYTIGAIADYVGLLSLTVAQSPNHCDPLPSILDVMSPSCTGRGKPTAITAGDLAFLRALYYRNTGLGPSPSRVEIQSDMLRQLKPETTASR